MVENKDDNVIPFKSPRLSFDNNIVDPIWLNGLKVGTIFLAKEKHTKNFFLEQYAVYDWVSPRTVLLINAKIAKEPLPVDPTRFCSSYDCHEVVRTHEAFLLEQERMASIEEVDGTDE